MKTHWPGLQKSLAVSSFPFPAWERMWLQSTLQSSSLCALLSQPPYVGRKPMCLQMYWEEYWRKDERSSCSFSSSRCIMMDNEAKADMSLSYVNLIKELINRRWWVCQMKLRNSRIQSIKYIFVIKYNLRNRRWEREEREEGKANSLKKAYTLVLMYISWEILHFNKLVRTFGSVK